MECGCPETWLIEYANNSNGAWDRRVLNKPIRGDFHLTPDGVIHYWNGSEWVRHLGEK